MEPTDVNECAQGYRFSELKPSQFIAEFEKHSKRAQLLMLKMPHIVPLRDRMILFRKLITQDKEGTDSHTMVDRWMFVSHIPYFL